MTTYDKNNPHPQNKRIKEISAQMKADAKTVAKKMAAALVETLCVLHPEYDKEELFKAIGRITEELKEVKIEVRKQML